VRVPVRDREVERYWQHALATSLQLAFVMDMDRFVLAASEDMARRLGAAADMLGHRCTSLLRAGDAPPGCPFHELLLDSGAHEAEVFSETLGGHLLVTLTPRRTPKVGSGAPGLGSGGRPELARHRWSSGGVGRWAQRPR
jgi:hypothetical protein